MLLSYSLKNTYHSLDLPPNHLGVFGNGSDKRKWTGTVTNLIDMRKKKVRIFCMEK
jgi:hypothetical protein